MNGIVVTRHSANILVFATVRQKECQKTAHGYILEVDKNIDAVGDLPFPCMQSDAGC